MTEAWKQWQGQVVGGEFHLQQYLGGSDHSAVFLTERLGRELRKAAIKLVPADPANAEAQLARWRQIAKLSHPQLIRLFDAGRCELSGAGLLYVVMEYAEENLSQIIPHRALTTVEAREMMGPVLDALLYLHGKGFVHSHIKPANILAVADRVKISSDQLVERNDVSRTRAGSGKYDAPELSRGEITPVSDIWSLGMTLVEVLTQRLPDCDSDHPRDPVLPDSVPVSFRGIAHRCLRVDPQRRWSAAEIRANLQLTSPTSEGLAADTQPKLHIKWRYVIPAAALVVLCLLMWTGPGILHRRSQSDAAPIEVSGATQAEPESPPAPETMSPHEQPAAAVMPPAKAAARVQRSAAVKTSVRVRPEGSVIHRVLPDVPQSARITITGKVRVRVKVTVDPSGKVTATALDFAGPSKYFARLASEAAGKWEFAPPREGGQDVASEWMLRFAFGRETTEVDPVQTAP